MIRKVFAVLAAFLGALFLVVPAFGEADGISPWGTNTAMDLLSPVFAGAGGFTTTFGAAAAGALNPAAGGDAERIVFELGYLGISGLGDEEGYGNVVNLGTLFPTRYAVFGASLRLLQSPFASFPLGTTFGGNLTAAKEIYPGMSLGAGFNFGFGEETSLSGDLGFRYNMGKLGPFENFTWAAALRSLGLSWTPSPFSPAGGVSFDLFRLPGKNGKSDPLKIGLAADLGVPSFQNLTGKLGLSFLVADLISLSAASHFNLRESAEGNGPSPIPSIGLGVNIRLKSGGPRIAGGRLPTDGEVALNLAAKPLYNGLWAAGGGLSWYVGVRDNNPPVITVDYPEALWFSPNNDGKVDLLEFPVSITDQRYIAEWVLEIADETGKIVRTYRNKERRPETEGVRNIINRILDVKSGVEVPSSMRWDGIFESGETAPDGKYGFNIRAVDDNGNSSSSISYEVFLDNTPPEVVIEMPGETIRTFSPDGDGNKDTLVISQNGSREDLWEAAIYDMAGNKIRDFALRDTEVRDIVWDGKDDEGFIVADGVYGYRIGATDKAMNSGEAALENIIVSTIQPTVNLGIGEAWFSPNRDGVKDTLGFNLAIPTKEGIAGWEIRVYDREENLKRTLPGLGQPPARLDYDGRSDQGIFLNDGEYYGVLGVRYRNGYVSSSSSPNFHVDTQAPRASARIEDSDIGGIPIFSPDNDGSKDELVIRQEASEEEIWTAEIRRADSSGGSPVKTFRFTGIPPSRLAWDGTGDGGALAPDGVYTYELFTTDLAGNSGRSGPRRFELNTERAEILLSADLRAFSPNNDGVKDRIALIPQIKAQAADGGRARITNWVLEIRKAGEEGPVRRFGGGNNVPQSIPWDGKTENGAPAPDGDYDAWIDVSYDTGYRAQAQSRPFTLDTRPPQAELFTPYTVFSPNGDGNRDVVPFNIATQGNDEWTGIITDARGNEIRRWTWTGRLPSSPLLWNGTDQAGNIVPNGTYGFSLSAADEAGNSTSRVINNIILDARVPQAIFTASTQAVAPKAGVTGESPQDAAVRFNLILSLREGIESWNLELKDSAGALLRRWSPGGTAGPPAALGWNGLDERGAVKEGRYTPVLTINYVKGDVVQVSALPILVDVSGPVLDFSYKPEYFSPDNDGVEDDLEMFLSAKDASPLAGWSLEIREPEPPNQLFYRIEGRGQPSERIVWNGRSNKGELVQAATDYLYTYRAQDSLGNGSVIEGKIGVDVLVIRDGDLLRIQIPSIVFRANAADFEGLPKATVDNNNRVLRRVGQILNKFRDYQITVEGHANPVLGTDREEKETLQPLSEARARAVVDWLNRFGVSRNRVSFVGKGGTKPVVSPQDQNNRWKNRRVEFILNK